MNNILQKAFLIIIISSLGYSAANAQGKGVGLGIMVGQPTGVNAKIWLSKTSAIVLGGAYNFKNEAMQVQADYLYHFNNAFPITTGKIPVYAGVGGTVSYKKNGLDPDYRIRIPVGLSYFLPTAPIDVFVEAVPVIIVKPESKVSLNGNVGVRYYF